MRSKSQHFRWLVVVLTALSLSAPTYAASKKKKKKKKSADTEEVSPDQGQPSKPGKAGSVDLQAGLGLYTLTAKPSDGEGENAVYNGFAMGGLAHYNVRASPTVRLPLGGGLRIISASYSKDSVAASISITSLALEGGGMFALSKQLEAGLAVQYDMLLSGSGTIKLMLDDEELSASFTFASFSQMSYGPRLIYHVSPALGIGGEFLFGSGSFTVKSENGTTGDPVSYSSTNLGGFITYRF